MINNKLEICRRFLQERENIEKNRSKFARKTGLSESAMRKWEKSTEIPGSAFAILEEAGLDMHFVLTGKSKELPVIEFPDLSPKDFREIPFYPDEIAAGQPLEVRDAPEGIVIIHKDWCKQPDKMVAVRVSSTGTSMEPTIPAGAIVTIDTTPIEPTLLLGKPVAIYKKDDGTTIKRLAQTTKGWCGIPDNRDPIHQVIMIEEGDRIIGKVNSVHYAL